MKLIINLSAILLLSGLVAAQSGDSLSDAQKEELVALRKARDAAKAAYDKAQRALDAKAREMTGVPEPGALAAEEGDKATALYEFAEDYNLKVRRTLKAGDQATLPALFQYTLPAEGEDSWSSDIGIAFGRDFLNGTEWRVVGEYHHNTLSTARVDTWMAGLGLLGQWGTTGGISAAWSLDGSYKRDGLVSGEGGLVSLMFFPQIPKAYIGGFSIGDPEGFFHGTIEPFLGAEFESGNGASVAFAGGERTTLRAGVSAIGWLFPSFFRERIELAVSLGYWGNVSTTGLYDSYDDNQIFFSGALTYWLNSLNKRDEETDELKKHFGLSLRYLKGDNPVEGAFDQDTWTFGFAIQF